MSPHGELEQIDRRARARALARAARITPAIGTTFAVLIAEWCVIGPALCCGAMFAVGVIVGVAADRVRPPVPDP